MFNEILNILKDNYIIILSAIGIIVVMLTVNVHFPERLTKYALVLFSLVFVLSVVSAIDQYVGNLKETATYGLINARRICMILGYVLRPLVIMFAIFIVYDMPPRMKILFQIPAAVNGILYLSGFFNEWTCYIDNKNDFHRNPLGYMVFVISALYAIFMMYAAIKIMVKENQKDGTIVLYMTIANIISAVLDSISQGSTNFLVQSLSISVLLYYLYFCSTYSKRNEEEMAKMQKNELALSQIRPHFMYNVLSSIYYLCDHDPKKAKEAVNSFSIYLRNNLDEMRKEQVVPISDELSYTKNYLSLEKIRFGDDLTYDFEIDNIDFSLPKFTLQPLVENAVKHGISQKIGVGHIQITIKDKGEYILVGVRDDGVGFDPSKKPDDGRSHTGIENIRFRIKSYLNEDLHIESKPGEGCYAWFKVLKEKE